MVVCGAPGVGFYVATARINLRKEGNPRIQGVVACFAGPTSILVGFLRRYLAVVVSLILASASPARLLTLQRTGVYPEVRVSQVDEDRVIAERERVAGPASASDVAGHLARSKAREVATRPASNSPSGALVLGCDSVLEFDGQVHGKPRTAEVARQRWQAMRGHSGVLHTGHCLIELGPEPRREVSATAVTRVDFADLSDAEIAAYVETGEPLAVAGGFTVDGLGAPYVTSIEGDYHNVVGISLPLLRVMLAKIGIAWHDLRTAAADSPIAAG